MTTKYIIMQYISYKFLLLFLVYSWAACNQEEEKMAGPMVDPDKLHVQPLSPWEALSTFEVEDGFEIELVADRKSTRLNSSHVKTSYAVFCLKKKTKE